jgi:hypothetical protein
MGVFSKSMISEYDYKTLAPLYQQVVDWFREKHKILIEVYPLDSWNNFVFKITVEDVMTPFTELRYNEQEHTDYYKALTNAMIEALKLI